MPEVQAPERADTVIAFFTLCTVPLPHEGLLRGSAPNNVLRTAHQSRYARPDTITRHRLEPQARQVSGNRINGTPAYPWSASAGRSRRWE